LTVLHFKETHCCESKAEGTFVKKKKKKPVNRRSGKGLSYLTVQKAVEHGHKEAL